MSTLRVFEIAREYGIESKELMARMTSIGIDAKDHLTALDKDSVDAVRRMLATAPSGDVIEKRVNRTVRRRRARRQPEPVVQAQVIAPPPEPTKPEFDLPAVVVSAPAPVVVPVQAPVAVAPVQAASEAAIESLPPATVQADAPAPVPAAAVVDATSTPVAVAPAAAVAAPAAAPVAAPAGNGKGDLRPNPLPVAPSKPTMDRAVVVMPAAVNRTVLANIEKTRRMKGYDQAEPKPGDQRQATGEARTMRRPDAAPARPGDARRDKKKGPGRRLVIDKRRDHLVRRGLLHADDIFKGSRSSKKKRPRARSKAASTTVEMKESKRVVKVGAGVTIGELAQKMMVKTTQVIGKLMQLGVMATVNQTVDFDTATMICEEFGWRVEDVTFDISDYLDEVEEVRAAVEHPRPPVVTVMGHVDHGKTSLLDAIRGADIAGGESGGITQHIGAYSVDLPNDRGQVVFIDTPGHAAFTAMRARGSKATDIVILVVAADDGVMPQTIESINHAKAAKVPIVVAVNKIDKDNANPDRVLGELSERGLVAEQWGGEVQVHQVSALKNIGVQELLEGVLLQSEVMELSGNPNVPAKGVILEGRLERGRGPIATLLVQEGTLNVGDTVVSGLVSGRVRGLTDDKGNKIQSATPSMPVEVTGLSGVPRASDSFIKVKDDKAAKKILEHREQEARTKAQIKKKPVSLDALRDLLAASDVAELNIIVKADVHGSSEALKDALEGLDHPEVKVKVIHSAVGGINESDVNLASASNALIIGFSVRPESKARRLADALGVDLKLYTIIYDALDDVKLAMAGLLSPIEREKATGTASVRMTLSVPKAGTIAGCLIESGAIKRGGKIRLIRDSRVIYEGSVQSLRRFKDDVREVKAGYECGIGIGYNDIREGDSIEAFEIEQVAATLDV